MGTDITSIGQESRKTALDIHDYPSRLKRELAYLEKSKLSVANKTVIRRFHDDCFVQGLSKPRIIKLIESMRTLAGMLRVDLEKAQHDDLKDLVSQIETHTWTSWTKVTYKTILKKFYKWLRGNNEDYPPEVKFIKTTLKQKDVQLLSPKDLITEEEVNRAINKADHPRSKAFLAVLAESGCRVGEIGNLTLKSVSFDRHGGILNVTGKTGSRRVRIVQSVKHLANWLDCHPFKDNPDAAVWINVGAVHPREPSKYAALAKVIRDAFKAAGIRKRCNPHIFRHSRASILANHLTEFQMNHYFGWTQGSDMPSTYIHMTGKDLDGAILKMNEQPSVDTIQLVDRKMPDLSDDMVKSLLGNAQVQLLLRKLLAGVPVPDLMEAQ